LRAVVTRVVLLGPAHRVAIRGLAVPTVDAFETPLGIVRVDTAAVARALQLPQVFAHDGVHALEHSIEVQLPFLQTILADFAFVPFAIGDSTADEVAEVIDLLWGGPETLIVISSDLSHYLPYDDAQRRDRRTVGRILALDAHLDPEEACGACPLNGLLVVAERRGLVPRLLDLRNSGDTAGEPDHVVGYAAVEFVEADHAGSR
jgi:AmmeMemoRadiSam system protein B